MDPDRLELLPDPVGPTGPTPSFDHHSILVDDAFDDDPLPLGDCGEYSRPLVFLDLIWNLAFVVVAVFVLLTTVRERPSTPLRLWICGYALQCVSHVGFMWLEYQRRSIGDFAGDDFDRASFAPMTAKRIIKRLQSVNTIISSIWWVFGFYWIVVGGHALLQDAPRLYWLSVVFLAFDVFFIIFCLAMASLLFIALFCCFPILATVAYAMKLGEGASEDDIRTLPKYTYRETDSSATCEHPRMQERLTGSINSTTELTLQPEDSECCICLFRYVDGAEICALPCNHYFHKGCISKWLRINATCPLCKFNILRGEMMV